MNKVFGNLLAQFNEYFKTLSPVKRMSIIIAGVISFMAIAITAMIVSGKTYEVLMKNVNSQNLSLIINKLKEKNIPYELADEGSTILVPQDMVYSTQMAMWEELGTANIGTVDLSLFKDANPGMTKMAQRANYQRALQGELMKAINTLSSIRRSMVILALPEKKSFMEKESMPSASVTVEMQPGKTLTPSQVDGIIHLVASSIENLDPESVTVIDSNGKRLSKRTSGGSRAADELLEIQDKIEDRIKARIETQLSRVLGEGAVDAQVFAQVSPKKVDTVQQLVDPDASAIIGQTSNTELLDGARTNPVGIPGSRAELPNEQGKKGDVGFRQNVNKELKTTNFENSKTVKNISESAGTLERLTVSVLVDGVHTKKKNDKGEMEDVWTPRSPEDLKRYENIIKGAIGFNVQRGDSVTVENMQFKSYDWKEADKILTTLERKKLLHSLFKWSLLGLSLALFFFMVIRPFMRWITDSFQDTVEDMLPRTIEELEELQTLDNTLPGMVGALPTLEESIDPDKAESELLKERIISVIEADPEKASGAFSLWLNRRDM